MLIRIAVAISKKEQEEQLVFKLTGLSMVLKNEFDIALYSNDFDRLLDNIKNIDIVISDFTVLERNIEKIGELYTRNGRCLPILLGPFKEMVSKFLIIRPVEYIENIENICPEDKDDKIRKIVDLFTNIVNKGLKEKTDNDVLYITTRHDSYAIAKDSILYCQSDLKYTVFVLDNGMLIRKQEKLQAVQEKYLWDFIRVHQSFLINPKKIESIDKISKEVILSKNTRVPFSRKYAMEVRDLFNY